MDISIIGAGGAIGRQIAIGLVRAGLVPSNGRLQLVGRRGGPSEQSVPGIATDLADAFGEELPEIDLAFAPKDVLGDIIILAAGETAGRGDSRSRADLAAANRRLVEAYARAIARSGSGEELLLVLTNPVEPCVDWCSRYIERKRVIGMGAYLDTLRFRREIAEDLGVRRQRVQGLVLGEHGPRMVPCWSTVDVHGFESTEGRARLSALRRPHDPPVAEAMRRVAQILQSRGARAAYAHVARYGPALRAMVKPNITQLCGARSTASTAEMILRLLGTLLSGGHVLTAAQIKLEGEFLGLHGVVGAPIVMTLGGVDRVVRYDLSADEQADVKRALYVGPSTASKRTAPGARNVVSRAVPRASEVMNTRSTRPRTSSADVRGAQPWRCVLAMRSGARPGTAERVSAVFAGRGISLESVHAARGEPATMTLRFVASTPIKDHLARRLARMRDVLAIEITSRA